MTLDKLILMFMPNISFLPYNFSVLRHFAFAGDHGRWQRAGPSAQWPRRLPGHMRAIVAKQVPLGQEIMVVCCGGMSIAGNFYRKKLKYLAFFCRRMFARPSCGCYHFCAPAILHEGMRPGCPNYLKVFDGPYCLMTRRTEGGFCKVVHQ